MFCASCGSSQTDDSVFCSICGFDLRQYSNGDGAYNSDLGLKEYVVDSPMEIYNSVEAADRASSSSTNVTKEQVESSRIPKMAYKTAHVNKKPDNNNQPMYPNNQPMMPMQNGYNQPANQAPYGYNNQPMYQNNQSMAPVQNGYNQPMYPNNQPMMPMQNGYNQPMYPNAQPMMPMQNGYMQPMNQQPYTLGHNVQVNISDTSFESKVKGKLTGYAGAALAIIAPFVPFIGVFAHKASYGIFIDSSSSSSETLNLFGVGGDRGGIAIAAAIISILCGFVGIYYCYKEQIKNLIVVGVVSLLPVIIQFFTYKAINDGESVSSGGRFLLWASEKSVSIVLFVGFYLSLCAAIWMISSGIRGYYQKENEKRMRRYSSY